MVARLAPLQDGALGLDRDGENARVLFLQKARDAGEGAAGADPGDKGIHSPFHLLPELAGSGGVVEVGIGSIFELECGKRAGGFRRHGPAAPDGALHGLLLPGCGSPWRQSHA